MSTVLSIYTKNAYKEYLLPVSDNSDFDIGISSKFFQIQEDIPLHLEKANGTWRLRRSRHYYTQQNEEVYDCLPADDLIRITTERGELLNLVVTNTDDVFHVLTKYDISNFEELTIGSADSNPICYQFLDLVSKQHAVLRKSADSWTLEDTSKNGLFLNEAKLSGAAILQIGDCIKIFGLKIVYLGGKIAVSATNNQLRLNDQILPLHYLESGEEQAENLEIQSLKRNYFHRSPRNIPRLDTEPVEIEAPPAEKSIRRKPLFMIIGQAFTMAIPMLLGTLLAVYSTRMRGGSASAFLYTGVITAVGAAVFGVFWALMNLKYDRRMALEEENHRFEAYSDYLLKRVELIKEKYEKTRQILIQAYPDARVCTAYNGKNHSLWSRNRRHEDFLVHRIGIGNLPFQVPIEIPKEKLTLSVDGLMRKPQIIKKEYETLYDVPVRVDLSKDHLIGLIGGPGKEGALDLMHILSAQIAANNSYADVKLVYIYDSNKYAEEWEFARWLPHVWSEDKKSRYVASTKEEASDVLYELVKIFRQRAEEEPGGKQVLPKPYYVLFVADASMLEGELITKYIYSGQEELGLTTFIMTENYEQLPNLCECVIQKDEEFCGCYHLSDEDRCQVLFDTISESELDRMARNICGVEIKEVEKGGDIPSSLTFFDMYHVNGPEELKAEERWRKNRNYENMKAEVGVKAGGELCYLDVHEKYHGPHGLVAGTTGSGKSETLQTYMLALALNFSPDDVSFFIIDYKGGGMANLFKGLPHLIGQISNLSGNQVNRAMVSIKSENKRRQRIFNEHNVNNINLYTKLYKNGEASMPIPHLFIIIDEFAELKREESDFMKELISVAQVGRSLGVHLILATQKPSGTVDDNIWSNSKFRLCLRVQDRQDSNDMLHKPDAAYITQAGRCYLQVGNDELYELFQSAYSGAAYDADAGLVKTSIATMLSTGGKAALIGSSARRKQQAEIRFNWIRNLVQIFCQVAHDRGQSMTELEEAPDKMKAIYEKLRQFEIDYPETDYNTRRLEELLAVYNGIHKLISREKGYTSNNDVKELDAEIRELLKYVDENNARLPEQKMKTQLDAVVEYLERTAKANGYTHQFQLWMPLLPTSFTLEELEGYSDHAFTGGKWPEPAKDWSLEVPIGLCDDPVSQAQMPLVLNFAENGHHAFCGMIVSGKSTLLQTMIYSLIHRYSPDYVTIYAIDFSSNMLSAFTAAPHVGDVITEEETEKLDKFFHMMEELLETRKKLFKGGNYSQYVKANGVKVPAVIVAIDNYASFREKTGNQYESVMMHLAHDGVGYGIFLAITAGGFGSTEIQTKIGDNIKTVVCLQMNDKFQYADALRVSRVSVMPEANVKGRGLVQYGESVLEFQTALSVAAEDDYQRLELIGKRCEEMKAAWSGKTARKVPVIPEKPVWPEFEQLQETKDMLEDPSKLPVGYDMESAAVYGVDLRTTYCYLLSGRVKTGKTNALKALILSASRKGGRLVVIEHGTDELRSLAEAVQAEYIHDHKTQGQFFGSLIEPVKKRNEIRKQLLAEGREDEVFDALLDEEKIYVFLSDMRTFIDSVYKPEEGALNIRPFFENLTEKGRLLNIYFFACINQDQISAIMGLRGYENMVGYRTGMHFGGNVANVRYLDFTNMTYSEQGKVLKPGIGLLPVGNESEVLRVVVPAVKQEGGAV